MKLSLIFAPQSMPTSAPLGIAHLKSFIESNSDTKVKNIDLNPFFYSNTIKNFIEGKFALYKDKDKNEKSRELIKKAEEIFKGKNKDAFFKPEIYNPCAHEFLYLFERIFAVNTPLLLKYIKNERDISNALSPFAEKIYSEKPDILGFSILSPEQIYFSLALAKKIKQDLKIPIIFGGSAVRLYPKEYLKNYDFIDYVIKGDGEYPLLNILEGKDKKDIPNLAYKEDNKIQINKEENTTDLDKLPFPDFSDFELENYFCPEKVLTILSSRGCYWRKCAFCVDYDSVAMQYRVKSIPRLLEEINYLKKKHNTKFFFFADEMIAPARFKQISQELIKNDTGISYYAQAKPVKEFNKELFKEIHKSGCKVLMLGVESGCQRILNLINKGTDVRDVENFLKNSHEAGIKNAVFAFGGFPTEKEEEYKKTLDFLNKNRKNIDIQFTGYFRVAKNSRIIKNPERFGITEILIDKESYPLMPIYHYKVKEGIDEKKSAELFKQNYTFFLEMNKFSPFLGKFRDHILVYYSKPNS